MGETDSRFLRARAMNSSASTGRRAESMMDVPFDAHEQVRVALVGCGARGHSLLKDLLAVEGALVEAIVDVEEVLLAKAQTLIQEAGAEACDSYCGSEEYKRVCERPDIDLVIIATPWDLHVPVAVEAMTCGKHVGLDVPAATTLEDCWKLVDTSEATRQHCVFLENCCYGYNELLALNMVKAGLFGRVIHGEAAYIHDLRRILTEEKSEGLWRRIPHMIRDGNFYPTHGLGPVANYMGVHNGDAFDSLVSMSSLEANLSEYVRETFPESDVRRKEKYTAGDINTSIIRTKLGRTILLQHDVVSPRPYDRLNMISGTKGAFADFPARIYLDGQEKHEWQGIDGFKSQYEHPLWTRVGELARKLGGHGGMDFIMLYRLIECMREGLPPDLDVYDAAAWSAPTPLSQNSVAQGGAPQAFPDFTRGGWVNRFS